jgi:hypothetical protein
VYAEFPPHAAGLLSNLARQLIELLSEGEPHQRIGDDPLEALLDFGAPRDRPEDPALQRLLPDAHRDDEEAAAEFRRFTEGTLRQSKIHDATVVVVCLDEVTDGEVDDVELELDAVQARCWMRCLTDLRLALAARLDIQAGEEDSWENLPDDDERLPLFEIYGWLGYLLESLIDAVRR